MTSILAENLLIVFGLWVTERSKMQLMVVS
jgi:hypothetical protein